MHTQFEVVLTVMIFALLIVLVYVSFRWHVRGKELKASKEQIVFLKQLSEKHQKHIEEALFKEMHLNDLRQDAGELIAYAVEVLKTDRRRGDKRFGALRSLLEAHLKSFFVFENDWRAAIQRASEKVSREEEAGSNPEL